LLDDAGIYTLGPQPGSTCHGNYLHSQCEKYGILYHDGKLCTKQQRSAVTHLLTLTSIVSGRMPHLI
jgi:hypothetical protein